MAENSEEAVVKIAEKLIDTNTEIAAKEVDTRDAKIEELTKKLETVTRERDEAVNTLNSLSVKNEATSEFDEIFNNKKGD